jgi:UDP-2,3-diacylglucosamine hydrolase
MRNAAHQADLFVLAGDTFDFKWAHQPCADSFANHAKNWLANLAGERPRCQFQVLLGNHDHHPALMERLDDLASELPNLAWDPWFVRHGDAVFLHGDVANGYSTSTQLEKFRGRCERHTHRPGPLRNRFYDAVIATKLDRAITTLMFPAHRVAHRITRYLEHIGHCHATGTRDVYFGHTHRPMDGYQHAGMRFHNPGAPIKGSPFRILRAEI